MESFYYPALVIASINQFDLVIHSDTRHSPFDESLIHKIKVGIHSSYFSWQNAARDLLRLNHKFPFLSFSKCV